MHWFILNIINCIQSDMVYQKHRCLSCKQKYKGHRSGEYHVKLKACYTRNEKREFVKIGYWCPSCHRFWMEDKL